MKNLFPFLGIFPLVLIIFFGIGFNLSQQNKSISTKIIISDFSSSTLTNFDNVQPFKNSPKEISDISSKNIIILTNLRLLEITKQLRLKN